MAQSVNSLVAPMVLSLLYNPAISMAPNSGGMVSTKARTCWMFFAQPMASIAPVNAYFTSALSFSNLYCEGLENFLRIGHFLCHLKEGCVFCCSSFTYGTLTMLEVRESIPCPQEFGRYPPNCGGLDLLLFWDRNHTGGWGGTL